MSFFNVLPLIYSIDNETDIDDSYKATMQLVLPFAWLTVLEVLAVIGGFVMLIIPGIWLAFAFSLTSYVFVLEKRRGIAALRQSVDYIEGYWWAVLGRVLLMGIFVMLANAAVQWLTSSFSGRVGESIISLAFSLFTTPFTAIFFYVIYKNLKALKPELIEAESVAKGGIVKASVIVGVVALALVALIIIFLAWHGVARSLEFSQWMRHQ